MLKALAVIVIILIVAGGFYFESRRSNDLERLARELGLKFQPGQQQLPRVLQGTDFDLFTQGPSNINNWMSGSLQGHQVGIFGFSYNASSAYEGEAILPVTDDQNSTERRNQSVIWIGAGKKYPDFDLSPKLIHKRTTAARFGFNPITFDGDPDFNKHFVLLARNSNQVFQLFSESVRKQLMAHPGLAIESRGNNLLFYRHGERLSPQNIPQFLAEVETLMGLL